jgi:ATP-binding cassette subfamily B (MDR/TAP) protein 1
LNHILRTFVHVSADEATSALDATSRILVFEAVKRWRRNRTTIVITHDLSQILPTDFVYALKDGRVAEGGYRADLEVAGGEFQQMSTAQAEAGGFAVKEETEWTPEAVRRRDEDAENILVSQCVQSPSAQAIKRESMAIRPITLGNWMFDVVSDLTRGGTAALPSAMVAERDSTHLSRFVPMEAFTGELPHAPRQRRPSTLAIDLPLPSPVHTAVSRRLSLQFSPISPVYSIGMSNSSTLLGDFDSEDEKEGLVHILATSSRQRLHDGTKGKHERKRWDTFKLERIKGQTVTAVTVEQPPEADAPQESFLSVIRAAYPTIPHKPLLALGMLFAVISGSITPLFSFMLSRLLFEVAKGAQDVSVINTFGGIVLAIAIADGLFVGLKFIVFETAAMLWVNRLRTTCYRLVLGQDKWWFDRSENAAVKLCQILTRDGDDARSLISTVFAQGIVVVSMFAVGLIWALVRGWQLTLVGFAIAPVFILTMVVQSRLVAKCELRNKRAREDVAKGYYEVGMSLLTIRLLADHPVDHNQHPRYSSHGFRECFLRALQQIRGGRLAHGCTRRLRGGLYLWRRELPHLYFRGAAFLRWCSFGVAGHLLVLADGSSP